MIRLQFLLSQIIDPKHTIKSITYGYCITISHTVETYLVLFIWIIGGFFVNFLEGVGMDGYGV